MQVIKTGTTTVVGLCFTPNGRGLIVATHIEIRGQRRVKATITLVVDIHEHVHRLVVSDDDVSTTM